MTLKVKKLKHGIDKHKVVPRDPAIVGKWVEDTLEENGHVINRGAGIDLEDLGLEVKSRKISSKSAHTVGRMTTNAIINTPYNNSPIKKKIQTQYRVEYNDDCEVVDAKIYDFSEEWIQELIEASYEAGRSEIAAGIHKNHTKTYGIGIFEKAKDKDLWQYRISASGMKKIKIMAEQINFKRLFDY